MRFLLMLAVSSLVCAGASASAQTFGPPIAGI